MSVAAVWNLYGVDVGGTMLGGITSQGLPTNTTVRGEPTSGAVSPGFQALVGQEPRGTFGTMHIASALDLLTAQGADVGALTGGLSFYAQKNAFGGARASGSVHRKYNFADGIAVPRTLSCDYQGDASLDAEVVARYDGSNDPIVVTDSSALGTAPTDDERFTLGPLEVFGKTLTHWRGLEIDFGIMLRILGADSDIWPTFVGIQTVAPTLTLRGIDIEWLKSTNIPLTGAAATHANTEVWLKKRTQGSTFVADTTAEHIKFTAAGIAYIGEAGSASGSDPSEVTLVIECRDDGSNDPLVVDTSAAITVA